MRGPWRSLDAVEYATLEWVDWFNNRRLLEPIGDVPPAEFEQAYHRRRESAAWLRDSQQKVSGKAEAVQHASAGRLPRTLSRIAACSRSHRVPSKSSRQRMEPLLTPSNELTRFAMACLPHEYRSSAHPRLLKAGPSGNAVMLIGTGRRKFVVKIYRRLLQASSLLPNPQQCAAKDVWISLLPELKQLVPRVYFAEATHFGDEPISIAVHEYVEGEPATSVNVSVEQINRFAIHLGEICAKVNVTQVHGYGALLIPTSSTFDKPTWNDYVRQRLDATPEELLTTRQSSGSENHKLILSTLLTSCQDGPAELFHHDLIHNWSNVLVDAKSGKPRYIIDWDQAGGGRSVIVDLAVARFALRFRSHAQFGWKKFLQQFLAGYGVSLHNYKDQTLAKVNALSALYAARAIQISPERAAQQSLYIEDALNHSDLG